MNRSAEGYESCKGEIAKRPNRVLVSMTAGVTLVYALRPLEEWVILFVGLQTKVYEGMIVGFYIHSAMIYMLILVK